MTDQELQNKVLKIAEQDLLSDEERLEQANSDVVPFQAETVAQFKGNEQQGTAKERFLRPIKEPQTYMNLLYLLLSFPLGIAYFVLMVTGTALGFGLTPIFFIGLFILFGVLLAGYGVAMFERELTSRLLGIDIAPAHLPKGRDMRERILNILKSGVTWRGVLYAFLKFPVGIGSRPESLRKTVMRSWGAPLLQVSTSMTSRSPIDRNCWMLSQSILPLFKL